jgi:putative restriction endonuclease
VDEGDLILYTGEGGRDSDTGRQIADQTLTRGNAALVRHYLEGNRIRVVRGSSLDSPYAPASGYRYDGLYRIDRYDLRSGRDGYKVFQFRLVRLDEQPVSEDLENVRATQITGGGQLGTAIPDRTVSVVSRIIRSTEVGTAAKKLHDYTCQICGVRLEAPALRCPPEVIHLCSPRMVHPGIRT